MMPPPVLLFPDGPREGLLSDTEGTECCCDDGSPQACCYTYGGKTNPRYYCQEVISTVCLNTGGVAQGPGTTCTLGLCDEGDCPSCSNCGAGRLVRTGGLVAYWPFAFPDPIPGAPLFDCPYDVAADCTFTGEPCEVIQHCVAGPGGQVPPPGGIGVKTTSFSPFCINGYWHGVLRHYMYSENTPGQICANPMTGEPFCGWDVGWRAKAYPFDCAGGIGILGYEVESVTPIGSLCNGWFLNYWTNPATYTVIP